MHLCKLEENGEQQEQSQRQKCLQQYNIFQYKSKSISGLNDGSSKCIQKFPNMECKKQYVSQKESINVQIGQIKKKKIKPYLMFSKVKKMFKQIFSRMQNLSQKNQILTIYLTQFETNLSDSVNFNEQLIDQNKFQHFQNKISTLTQNILGLFHKNNGKNNKQMRNIHYSLKVLQQILMTGSQKILKPKRQANMKFRYLFRLNDYKNKRKIKKYQQQNVKFSKCYIVSEQKINQKMQILSLNAQMNVHPYYSLLSKNISKKQQIKYEDYHQSLQVKPISGEVNYNNQNREILNQNNVQNQQQFQHQQIANQDSKTIKFEQNMFETSKMQNQLWQKSSLNDQIVPIYIQNKDIFQLKKRKNKK